MVQILKEILEELKQHRCSNREDIIKQCISERLQSSLQVYYKELSQTVTNLNNKNLKKVSRNL